MVHKARRSSLIKVKGRRSYWCFSVSVAVASISAVHVYRKAFTGDDSVDESDAILYLPRRDFYLARRGRGDFHVDGAVRFALLGGFLTLLMAILIFIHLTRVVVEGVGPMLAAPAVISAVGSAFIGPAGRLGGHSLHLSVGGRYPNFTSWPYAPTGSNSGKNWDIGCTR